VYGLPALEGETDTCLNWIDMRVTADKYLASTLRDQSFERFWEHVRQIQTAEGILEINEKIAADASHDSKLVSASERLRGVWLHQVVQVPRFREELSNDKERMLAMIDELSKGGNLSSMHRKLSHDSILDPITNNVSRHHRRGRRRPRGQMAVPLRSPRFRCSQRAAEEPGEELPLVYIL
jgi:hypothetical protein